MLNLFISFLLLHYFFPLFLERQVLLLAHLRIPQYPILNEMIGLEGSLQHKPFMMFEQASALHPSFLPRSLVRIAVAPGHLPMFMVTAVFELSLIGKFSRDDEFSLAVFSIAIPVSLHIVCFT